MDTEPDFEEDLNEMNEAVNNALNELANIKAYNLKLGELRDFKAAQYALRNLSEDYPKPEDVAGLYQEEVKVTCDESDY